jgi:hypothetical protein
MHISSTINTFIRLLLIINFYKWMKNQTTKSPSKGKRKKEVKTDETLAKLH